MYLRGGFGSSESFVFANPTTVQRSRSWVLAPSGGRTVLTSHPSGLADKSCNIASLRLLLMSKGN